MLIDRRSTWLRTLVAGVLVVGGLAACSDDGDDAESTTTQASGPTSSAGLTTTTTRATTKTTTAGELVDVSGGDLPETPLTVGLLRREGTSIGFGVPAGSVTAAWYPVDDDWAVHFQGLTPEQANGKCLRAFPVTTTAGTLHPASPYGAGACDGDTRVSLLPPGSLRLCGNKAIILVSDVHVDEPGPSMGAGLDRVLDDGSIQSLWGYVGVGLGSVPALDVSLCETIS